MRDFFYMYDSECPYPEHEGMYVAMCPYCDIAWNRKMEQEYSAQNFGTQEKQKGGENKHE